MHHKYGCKATAAVDLEMHMVVKLSGDHNPDTHNMSPRHNFSTVLYNLCDNQREETQ